MKHTTVHSKGTDIKSVYPKVSKMTYYSRSRLSSHDSTSSDLFDEMIEAAQSSDLEPPPPKVKVLHEKPATSKGPKKDKITYAKVLYDYTYEFL